MNQQQKAEYDKLVDTLIARDEERAYNITDRIFWIMIENTHPSNIGDFIEPDPNNPEGTRNTERGQELFEELEEFVRNTI